MTARESYLRDALARILDEAEDDADYRYGHRDVEDNADRVVAVGLEDLKARKEQFETPTAVLVRLTESVPRSEEARSQSVFTHDLNDEDGDVVEDERPQRPSVQPRDVLSSRRQKKQRNEGAPFVCGQVRALASSSLSCRTLSRTGAWNHWPIFVENITCRQ